MQYDTENSGEFKAIKTDVNGYYGIAYSDGILMNDRGTGNGTIANMKWVINTYSGNSVSDSGSRYKFFLVESYSKPTDIESVFTEKPAYILTKEELLQSEGARIYGLDGRYVNNIMNAAPGVYLVLKDGKTYKIFLK